MTNRDTALTFAKGLDVLACFETGRGDLTMADIARLTGLDRATARRLCLTLESSGYLYRHGKMLRLTPKILAVGGGYLTAQHIGRLIQPTLNQFAEELNGEIALAVRDGARAIYIARSAVASARLSLGFSVGSTLPLLPTAIGRMLLASCTPKDRDQILNTCEWTRFTAATDMDRASIRTKIEDAATQGFSYVINEFEMGAAGVAVPIAPISGAETVLATSASANSLARPDQMDHVLDVLRRAAMRLRD
ncbi:helix-turn-helix domain-containing protein [Gymnodinialimonas sp. 2305UL16-5]|uniref:IclR family transcriptional regulator domain-containing protein n=1 Tax=Gymnodinialimonas mytili TaxID=3126503 RepID=UPI0030A67D59